MLKTILPEPIAVKLGLCEKRYRIDYPMTQEELAEKSEGAIGSIRRFERDGGIQLTSLIRILQPLDLDRNLDLLIPDNTQRPSYYLDKSRNQVRERATSPAKRPKKRKNNWVWGDEKESTGGAS